MQTNEFNAAGCLGFNPPVERRGEGMNERGYASWAYATYAADRERAAAAARGQEAAEAS